jgi:methanogenic corrinoid protein MtbC1
MNSPGTDTFAAAILQKSCQAFAGYAAAALLESSPETARRFGPDAFAGWKTHLAQRVLELSAALRMGEPELFVARVRWALKAFRARDEGADDLRASLRALHDVLGERLPESARNRVLAYLDQGIAALTTAGTAGLESELDPAQAGDRLALAYLEKVLAGDVVGAIDGILSEVRRGLSVEAAYLSVLLPAEREIGRLWHVAKVSVAEEHLATFAIQRTMAILSSSCPAAAANHRTAVVAAVSGNAHDIGLRAAADLYQLAGWRAIFLGADVPPDDLVAMLGFFDADVLLLGVTLAPQLPKAAETIALVRQRCERRVQVIVGGAAFEGGPDVWKSIGADGYATNLSSAVTLGDRLVNALV